MTCVPCTLHHNHITLCIVHAQGISMRALSHASVRIPCHVRTPKQAALCLRQTAQERVPLVRCMFEDEPLIVVAKGPRTSRGSAPRDSARRSRHSAPSRTSTAHLSATRFAPPSRFESGLSSRVMFQILATNSHRLSADGRSSTTSGAVLTPRIGSSPKNSTKLKLGKSINLTDFLPKRESRDSQGQAKGGMVSAFIVMYPAWGCFRAVSVDAGCKHHAASYKSWHGMVVMLYLLLPGACAAY